MFSGRTVISSQLFRRIGELDNREQDQLIEEVGRDPQAKRFLQRMYAHTR
jgi:hypothetical protein